MRSASQYLCFMPLKAVMSEGIHRSKKVVGTGKIKSEFLKLVSLSDLLQSNRDWLSFVIVLIRREVGKEGTLVCFQISWQIS